ncbi:MAG: Rpn family recombination-promoting nuclease/putative transposase, partial [Clostridiales bacterium]|nr:Rpn family recombination-promoting nuclease/putative transposase [Clostridiales bacterium]
MAESTENFTKSPTDSSIGANANSIGPIKTDSHKGPKHSSYHDQAYKMVFKRNSLFLEFLRLYTETDWLDSSIIKWVNLWNSDFEILDSGGIAADIIYEASEKEERVDLGFPTGSMAGIKTLPPDFSKYYLVLLEFQSRVDFTMPFRLLEYLIESERRIFLNTPVNIRERKGYRLPVIHPIVLFSDKQKMWTAEAQLRDFYENPGRFGDISPNFRYDVFNVNGISKAKLMEMEGALRLIFLLDQ